MNLADKLKGIREEVEKIRVDESIATSYNYYKELIPQLNFTVEKLKETKDEQNLVTIVRSIEDLVNKYIEVKPEEEKIESEAQAPIEKLEFTYNIYFELRSQGKTHDEVKEIATNQYHLKNSKSFRRWSSAYGKRKESLEKKAIEELPSEIVEKIKTGNFTAKDYILNVDMGKIQESALRDKFIELGKGKIYRGIKSGVAKKYKILERRMKETGQETVTNGNGTIYCLDSHGVVHPKREEAIVAEAGYK